MLISFAAISNIATSSKKGAMDSQSLMTAYINAADSDAYQHFDALCDAIRNLVQRSVGKREISDLEDFQEDCVLSIWTKISSIKADPASGGIDNIEAFIRRTVHNRYCDAIRRKRPKWYNLKLELMEVFSGKANVEGFALWQSPATGDRLCGFAKWEGSSKSHSSKCRELLDNASGFRKKHLKNRDPQELPTYDLAAAILDYCGGPVDIDAITTCVADLVQAHNFEPLSIDSQPDADDDSGSPVDWLVSPDTGVEKQVVDASWFNHVIDWFWREFTSLSTKQRKAVLYGMSDDQVMALASAVGLKEIAKSLEIDAVQLASLINKLPLPDAETATELGIQTRAVPSVRFKAWGRIRRRTMKSTLANE